MVCLPICVLTGSVITLSLCQFACQSSPSLRPQVIQLDAENRRMLLTHKPSLLKTDLPVLASYADAKENVVSHGWISVIKARPPASQTVFLCFYRCFSILFLLRVLLSASLLSVLLFPPHFRSCSDPRNLFFSFLPLLLRSRSCAAC